MTNDPVVRVLVIEEAVARRELVRSALEAAGYSVRDAQAGSAQAVAQEWRPDVILLDLTGNDKLLAALAGLQGEPEVLPLAVVERRLIERALERTNHDVQRAAALLEINPSTIYRKLQSWRSGEP